MAKPERQDVSGTSNFRPLGGYATPRGFLRDDLLWRSDGLADLGEAGRAALARLGVRTIVDLREDVERELHPDDVAGLDVSIVAVPVLGAVGHLEARDLTSLYRGILDARGTQLAQAVKALCDPQRLPAVVHCTAGKDRTGLVAALLLAALGVDDEDVAADYARTAELLTSDDLDRMVQRARQAGISEQMMAIALDAPIDAMRSVLAHVRESHGGARGYLIAHGVSAHELDAIADALVPADAAAWA